MFTIHYDIVVKETGKIYHADDVGVSDLQLFLEDLLVGYESDKYKVVIEVYHW